MKNRFIFLQSILIAGIFGFTHQAVAQELSSDPAQAAQANLEVTIQPSESAAAKETFTPKAETRTVHIPVPANATRKQIRRIEKINQALAEQASVATESPAKAPTRVQKAATALVLKKIEKNMRKAGIKQQSQPLGGTDLQSQSAAQALNNLTLIGIILMGAGLLFLFIIAIIGLLFFLGGLICLIIGLANG